MPGVNKEDTALVVLVFLRWWRVGILLVVDTKEDERSFPSGIVQVNEIVMELGIFEKTPG